MKKLIFILVAVLTAISCSDDLESLNQNIKDPATVSGESLFIGAQKALVDQIVTLNVNNNNTKLWVQYLQESTYTDESNYDQTGRSVPLSQWSALYKDVLKDLDEAAKIITATTYTTEELNTLKPNKLAIIEILNVYTYSVLVETFGDVPYAEALDINNLLPRYEDGLTIYKDLLVRLDAAINSLNTSLGSYDVDNIYSGNVASWKAFANSLKLRMGVVLSDIDDVLARSTVESAVSSGVFTSSATNANYHYLSADPNTNPIHVDVILSGRQDFVAAVTIENMMNNLEDPRRPLYFQLADATIGELMSLSTVGNITTLTIAGDDPIGVNLNLGDNVFSDGVLLGAISAFSDMSIDIEEMLETPEIEVNLVVEGYFGGNIGSTSAFADHSHVSAKVSEATSPGVLLDYAEVEFLLSEAAARTYAVGGDAKSHYDAGIMESILWWGGTQGEVDTYLATAGVDYDTAISNSTATIPWKEVIGNQRWLALFNRGLESWTSIRRLDYPIMAVPSEAVSGFPNRYTYPVLEQTLNRENYDSASSAIGGDAAETRLFFDKF